METLFKKTAKTNPQSMVLATPRMDFIDAEYTKLEPLITRTCNHVANLKLSYSKPIDEVLTQLIWCFADFESLHTKLDNFITYVIKASASTSSALINLLQFYKNWLNRAKEILTSPRDYMPYTPHPHEFLLHDIITVFESLEVVLREAIVSAKEAILLEFHSQLTTNRHFCVIV